jgi:hypothetical protein
MYELPRTIPDLKVLLASPELSAADMPTAFVEREASAFVGAGLIDSVLWYKSFTIICAEFA